ncbi:MAG: hypothetical protein Solivirus1_26 [Solivirus sp.]|uniref:Uncharacterized protein n=1 Tax=Solivirus sp. TaxID=2487772 RepID=A0A3G5AJQ2_9VIRU|nr:MAG: hypothetical protein Solivirus1_26 [Solivirus sp.]
MRKVEKLIIPLLEMDSEVYELFTNLYNTNIYLANRLLVDFPDEVIEELEKSRKYSNLFTPSLQNDLYREKLLRELPADLVNKISKNYKQYYDMIYIIEDGDKHNITNILIQAAKFDDPIPFELLFALKGIKGIKGMTSMSIYMGMYPHRYPFFAKAPKVLRYLLTLNDDYIKRDVISYLSEASIPITEEFLPLIGPINDNIKRELFIYPSEENKEKLRYFVEKYGITFNGQLMAYIAHYHHDRELINWLISHGSSPVDRVFYNSEFGHDRYDRNRGNLDYLNP